MIALLESGKRSNVGPREQRSGSRLDACLWSIRKLRALAFRPSPRRNPRTVLLKIDQILSLEQDDMAIARICVEDQGDVSSPLSTDGIHLLRHQPKPWIEGKSLRGVLRRPSSHRITNPSANPKCVHDTAKECPVHLMLSRAVPRPMQR